MTIVRSILLEASWTRRMLTTTLAFLTVAALTAATTPRQGQVASNPEDGIPAVGLENSAFMLVPLEEDEKWKTSAMEAAAIPFLRNHEKDAFMCKPRHVHLSLGSAPTHQSMTISFSIPSAPQSDKGEGEEDEEDWSYLSCHPRHLSVSVVYGEKKDSSSYSASSSSAAAAWLSPWWDSHHPRLLDNEFHRVYATDQNWTSYNHTNPRKDTFYQSDWLYHVQLHGILKSATKYWYRIEVQHKHSLTNPITFSKTQTSSSSSSRNDVWGYYRTVPEAGHHLRGAALAAAISWEEEGSHRETHALQLPLVGTSPTLGFTTPPAPAEYHAFLRTKFSIVGDLGQTYNSTQTMRHMWQESHLIDDSSDSSSSLSSSIIIIAGDMSYADSDQVRWDNWFTLMEPLASQIPILVAAGNHEIECDGAGPKYPFVPYENRFHVPNRRGPARIQPVEEAYRLTLKKEDCSTPSAFQGHYDGGNSYYSFVYGPARVIVLSSYSDTAVDSEQYRWLQQTLRQANTLENRQVVPWILVFLHTQWYTTFSSHLHEVQTTVMREAMEPLLIQYKVNLVICGHDHGYMRSKPMAFGKSDPTQSSPTYLIVGEGGNREHHSKEYVNADQAEEWVEVRDKTEYGFGTLDFISAKTAKWKWIRDRKEGSFSDAFTLENSYVGSL